MWHYSAALFNDSAGNDNVFLFFLIKIFTSVWNWMQRKSASGPKNHLKFTIRDCIYQNVIVRWFISHKLKFTIRDCIYQEVFVRWFISHKTELLMRN